MTAPACRSRTRDRPGAPLRCCAPLVLPLILLAAPPRAAGQVPPPGLRVEAPAVAPDASIPLGRAFPLTVTRSWDVGSPSPAWSSELLAPLVVVPIETSRDVSDGRVRETRRLRAYGFQLGPVTLPASAGSLRITIVSALGTEHSAAAELPQEPFDAPLAWRSWILLAAAFVAGAIAIGALLRRRARLRSQHAVSILPPHRLALRRLEALRARAPGDRAALRADAVEASAILRAYVEARFAIAARGMTAEQLVGHPQTRSLGPVDRNLLAGCLADWDLVKYGNQPHDLGTRDAQLRAIEAFVEHTARQEEAA